MIENEIKILNINHIIVMKHLESHGAQGSQPITIQDRYYDTSDQTLESQNLRMRIRSINNTDHCITKKTKLSDSDSRHKSMKEEDLVVDSREQWHSILSGLGLLCQRTKQKTRISYRLDDMIFDIDFYDNIPPILEIEWYDVDMIYHWIRVLWLQHHTQVKRGSRKLFKHYNIPITK